MKYRGNIVEGTFLSRPNRFIAFVKIGDKEEKCHVKNTGRCKELLVPGCKVYLEESDNPNRSTRFDLIATEKKEGDRILLINMDSQAPNSVVEEWLEKGELFGKKAAIKRVSAQACSGKSLFTETVCCSTWSPNRRACFSRYSTLLLAMFRYRSSPVCS